MVKSRKIAYIYIIYLRLVSSRRVRDVFPYFDPSATVAVKQISFRVCDYFKPLLAHVRGIDRYRSEYYTFIFISFGACLPLLMTYYTQLDLPVSKRTSSGQKLKIICGLTTVLCIFLKRFEKFFKKASLYYLLYTLYNGCLSH